MAHLECQGLGLVFSPDYELQTRFVQPRHFVVLKLSRESDYK